MTCEPLPRPDRTSNSTFARRAALRSLRISCSLFTTQYGTQTCHIQEKYDTVMYYLFWLAKMKGETGRTRLPLPALLRTIKNRNSTLTKTGSEPVVLGVLGPLPARVVPVRPIWAPNPDCAKLGSRCTAAFSPIPQTLVALLATATSPRVHGLEWHLLRPGCPAAPSSPAARGAWLASREMTDWL